MAVVHSHRQLLNLMRHKFPIGLVNWIQIGKNSYVETLFIGE